VLQHGFSALAERAALHRLYHISCALELERAHSVPRCAPSPEERWWWWAAAATCDPVAVLCAMYLLLSQSKAGMCLLTLYVYLYIQPVTFLFLFFKKEMSLTFHSRNSFTNPNTPTKKTK